MVQLIIWLVIIGIYWAFYFILVKNFKKQIKRKDRIIDRELVNLRADLMDLGNLLGFGAHITGDDRVCFHQEDGEHDAHGGEQPTRYRVFKDLAHLVKNMNARIEAGEKFHGIEYISESTDTKPAHYAVAKKRK